MDEALFRHMLKHKSEFSQRSAKESMDLDFEREVMTKEKDALKKVKSAQKRGIFNLFKKN